MQWLNEPASWQRAGDVIKVDVDPGTDFWCETGYGYTRDSGHVYGRLLPGDLDVSVRIRPSFTTQYEQAGIMLRADERTWLKTGLEFFEGRCRLSTVLTLGRSSWVMADLPPSMDEITLRVSRRGDAVEVRYTADSGASELAALLHLPPGRDVLAGVMCAAPEGTGFSVTFRDLRIVGREWAAEPDGEAAAGWAEEGGASPEWERDERPDWAGEPGAGWAGEGGASPEWEREEGPDWAGEPGADWAGEGGASPEWEREDRPDWAGEAEPAAEPDEEVGVDWAPGRQDDGAKAGSRVSDLTEPDLQMAGPEDPPPAGAGQDTAKQPAPGLPEPLDPADEWISLLTADPADE